MDGKSIRPIPRCRHRVVDVCRTRSHYLRQLLAGRALRRWTLAAGLQLLDLDGIQAGVYLLQLTAPDGSVVSHRIMRQ